MIDNTFLISSIKEITKDKLIFINAENKPQEIDFLECRKNWTEHQNNSNLTDFDGNPIPKITVEECHCVGERDWFSEKPYYKFYSNPKVRFEICPKKRFSDLFKKHWQGRYYPEFHKVTADLAKVGLSTFDLG